MVSTDYHFSARNTNIYKICQLRKAIFSTFYNISQPNFAILLNIGCSFKLCMVIFLPILNFFKFHVKGERSIKALDWRVETSYRECNIYWLQSNLFLQNHCR